MNSSVNTINITADGNMDIVGGRIFVNGVEINQSLPENVVKIIIEGSVTNLKSDKSITCGNVGGDVIAGSSVNCENITGSVRAGSSVNCDDIGGDVHAGSSVNCDRVEGNVTAKIVNR